MKQKNKRIISYVYLALSIWAILFLLLNTIYLYRNIQELKIKYEEKICVCLDNYNKGFEDCKKIYEERIDYCFDRCKYRLMVVGEPSHAACMWDCFYPIYPIHPIIGGCATVHPDYLQQCCDQWAEENDIIIPLCIGQWEIVNQQCAWNCRLGITK